MTQLVNNQISGELLHNEVMARYTSWRVGGPAERMYKPAGLNDLMLFLQGLPESEPVFWLGLGSNILVRDGGIRGTVIATQGSLAGLEIMKDGCVRAEAGVTCAKVARFCSSHALSEAEFLAGIPGTMGGALAMNAGAFGGETWSMVESVEMLDRQGRLHIRNKNEFEIAYRKVSGPKDEWFVAAHLRLKKDEKEEKNIKKDIKALLEERNKKQPVGLPSCGSVFRNPENGYAAELIEKTGLKGLCEGNACVSEKHANFIINTGGATALDIEKLIKKVSASVQEQQGVLLEKEVHIVGEFINAGDNE
ncbi:MAG: UDP-N-acetylmuramate dehydrogenase [Gammaproteobacteria bacterium]|nr:UDP-N-acetylmuramate dehydrogenase [Gammaproteobacteria bacterium]